jgi:hypothetical protein
MGFLIRDGPIREEHLFLAPDKDPESELIGRRCRQYGATRDGFLFFLGGVIGFAHPAAQDRAVNLIRAT